MSSGAELRLIGTDPDEWPQGVDAFSQFSAGGSGSHRDAQRHLSEIEAYSVGGVRWGAGRARFETQDGLVAGARFSRLRAR